MRPEAVEAMLPFLRDSFGNPSGSHAVSREAKKALEEARDVAAECLGAEPDEIVFTGSGTEADNLAVIGAHEAWPAWPERRGKPGKVICSAVEHHAVLHATHVVVGDFTDAGQLVEPGFTLAVVAFNTLFELASQREQLRCLEGIAGVLTERGLLVVEALAPDLTRLEQTVSALSIAADRAVLQATRHDATTQVVDGADVTVTDGQVRLSPWSIRYVSVPELDLMARLAGLSLRHRWGGWHREPFTAASPSHVSVYERQS